MTKGAIGGGHLEKSSLAWRSAGASIRISEPGEVRALCRASTPAIVDLPDWRAQLRSTRVEPRAQEALLPRIRDDS